MCYLYIIVLVLLFLLSICFYSNKKNIESFRNRGNRRNRRNRRNYHNKRFRNFYSWIPFYNTLYPDVYWNTPLQYIPDYSTYNHPTFYNSYNWFDYRTCPSGCVANSMSPSGFSCNKTDSITSCRTDYDCSGCNVPVITSYY